MSHLQTYLIWNLWHLMTMLVLCTTTAWWAPSPTSVPLCLMRVLLGNRIEAWQLCWSPPQSLPRIAHCRHLTKKKLCLQTPWFLKVMLIHLIHSIHPVSPCPVNHTRWPSPLLCSEILTSCGTAKPFASRICWQLQTLWSQAHQSWLVKSAESCRKSKRPTNNQHVCLVIRSLDVGKIVNE